MNTVSRILNSHGGDQHHTHEDCRPGVAVGEGPEMNREHRTDEQERKLNPKNHLQRRQPAPLQRAAEQSCKDDNEAEHRQR